MYILYSCCYCYIVRASCNPTGYEAFYILIHTHRIQLSLSLSTASPVTARGEENDEDDGGGGGGGGGPRRLLLGPEAMLICTAHPRILRIMCKIEAAADNNRLSSCQSPVNRLGLIG